MVPLGVWLDRRTLRLVFPSAVFLFLFSFLPHKELRFVIYIFPMLNVASAAACQQLWQNRSKSWNRKFLALGACLHLLGNVAFTMLILGMSRANYPGGAAMESLHRRVNSVGDVRVHLDNLACQTGVSRFTQVQEGWLYDKTENLTLDQRLSGNFTHLIIEASDETTQFDGFEVLETVQAFAGANFVLSIPPVRLKYKPALHLLQRVR